MKVPPTRSAARNTPVTVGQATLASTPPASTRHARAKVVGTPRRVEIRCPQEDRGRRGQAEHDPDFGFQGTGCRHAADDGHQEGGSDDVTESKQPVGGDETAQTCDRPLAWPVAAPMVTRALRHRGSAAPPRASRRGTAIHCRATANATSRRRWSTLRRGRQTRQFRCLRQQSAVPTARGGAFRRDAPGPWRLQIPERWRSRRRRGSEGPGMATENAPSPWRWS